MEFYVSNEEFNKAVNIANKAIPNRTTAPILECILFTVGNGEIRLTATDTELGIESYLEAEEIKEDGVIAVDAKLLTSIVGKLPTGKVHVKTNEDNVVSISCGKAKFKISGRDGSEYPSLENVERNNCITLTQGELKDLIRQTIFSCSLNDAQKMMQGIYFEISDKLKVTALDGHRIAIREIDIDHEPLQAIIPSKMMSEIMKMPFEGDVDIYFTDSQAMFCYGTANASTRLIDGTYYSVDKMITPDYITTLKIDRKALIECLDRSTLLIKDIERKPVVMTIGDDLSIDIVTQIGDMHETIPAEVEGTKDWEIGVNPKFMLDALRVIDDETVMIYFNGAKSPCQIKGEGYTYLVLPIQLAKL